MTNWKNFLTEEVLHECWHTDEDIQMCSCGTMRMPCLKCGIQGYRRTFNNPSDMLELYRYMYENNRWKDFFDTLRIKYHRLCNTVDVPMIDYIACLFCFGDEDYEDRCKLVAEFYGYKEGKK